MLSKYGELPPFGERSYSGILLFLMLVSLGVGSLFSAVGGSRFLRPLQNLIDGTKEVSAGNFDIHPVSTVVRYAHRAELGIALLKAYWGSGLASALMTIMLREAKVLRYEQVELEVLAENARAVSLYQKFGFVQTGTLPHFYKYRDGRYADAHYMVCKL